MKNNCWNGLGVGYRFKPTDYELISYLREQVKGQLPVIGEIIVTNKEGYWTLCSIGKTGKSEDPVPDEVERNDRANFRPDQESIVEGQRAYNAPEYMYNEPQPAYYESYALEHMYMGTQSAYYQPYAAAPEGMVHMGDQNELIPPELVEALSFKPQY
ncbi:hypothetical protein Syun_007846 [Stephania yunnanensis]|uniref:NAC domain-containing protein n=1 Tax=Stephania yunnanensis TaxID=152371 RepID=A0AAP0L1T3_9MAGN